MDESERQSPFQPQNPNSNDDADRCEGELLPQVELGMEILEQYRETFKALAK